MATTVVATVTSVETPALPAPAGQISNFSNPPSLIQWGILCVSVCLSTTTVVILLRIYVRLVIKRQWIVEDCKSADSTRSILLLTNLQTCVRCPGCALGFPSWSRLRIQFAANILLGGTGSILQHYHPDDGQQSRIP